MSGQWTPQAAPPRSGRTSSSRTFGLILAAVLAVAALATVSGAFRREPPDLNATLGPVDPYYLKMDCDSLSLEYHEEEYVALNAEDRKTTWDAVQNQVEIQRAIEQKSCPAP